MILSLISHMSRALRVSAPFKQLRRRVAPHRVALALLVAAFPALSGGASAVARPRAKAKLKPAVTSAQVKNVSGGSAAGTTRFTLVLGGRGFGKEEGDISVSLIAPNVPDPLRDAQKTLVIDSQIVINAEAAHGTYVLVVKKGEAAIDTSDIAGVTIPGASAATKDPTGTPQSAAAAATSQKPFYVDFESQAYPSNAGMMRYGLVVKSDDGKFAADPKLMTVQIWPAGASDVVIRSATARRLHVDFWAPEKFEVKGVDVSVSDPSNPLRIAVVSTNEKEKEKAKPAPPAEPKIDSTEVVFLHRHQGVGRLKIEGSGFGEEHARPPLSSEAFLMNCQHQASKALKTQYLTNNQVDARLTQTPPAECGAWQTWEKNIRDSVKLTLVPRNVDLRIEQTQILYIDDKLIDVYFEFSNYGGYSEPLRLARTTLTVRKNVAPKTAAPAKPQAADGAVAADGSVPARGFIAVSSRMGGPSGAGDAAGGGGAAAVDAAPAVTPAPEWKTFLATKEVGLKQDANLQYHYTVLDNSQTDRLFGSGVSRTFYAIQLSVTNRGAKKVIVPLSSIEAEIEWAYAETPQAFFEQGPATIAPQPLDTVTAFFDANNKVKGKSARLFNVFEGMTTLGASLIPLFGPGFKDAHVIFTGGLVPGVRKGIGDLSGQQLQNLAGMSWQNVEQVSPNGGSVNKYVFIQRGDQLFGDNIENAPTKKRIKNISGVELVGFEVVESEPKAGTKVN